MLSAIVHFLKASQGYVSGEEISRELNISRSAIWKYMQELRKLGYEIAAVPHLGYRLESVPDKLLIHEIQRGLETETIGQEMICLDSVDSTMNVGFALAQDGSPEGTVICAETQTKGRGRLGRAWSSPKGKGVYMSIILRPALSPMETAKLTLLSAVSLSEAIEDISGISPQIKWPNDLQVNGNKLAGILTEMRAELDQVRFVVMGIGLNVNNAPSQMVDGAVSMRSLTQNTFNRVEVVQCILRALERRYKEMLSSGFAPVLQEWKRRSVTLNARVRLQGSQGDVEGVAIDLSDDGGLMVRTDGGAILKRMAGDVTVIPSEKVS